MQMPAFRRDSSALGVLHVVDSLERGGLERVVTDLALAQRRQGHRVTVFSILETQGFRAQLEQAGVPVLIGGKSRPMDLRVLRSLRAVGRDGLIDVVHAHSFVPNYYAAVALLGLRRPPVLVGTCHDMGVRLDDRRLRFFYRCSLARTRGVAMVGQQVYDRFVTRGLVPAQRARVVLNAIPLDRFQAPSDARAAGRACLGLPDDAPVVGAVGRLVALKNHRQLVRLLPRLRRHYPEVRLVLVGGGPEEAALREEARALGVSQAVVFAGPRDDVAALLPAFDVFALPSRTEGLSIALLEACASGTPVVATRVGGNPEIIRHGETGLLVPVDDDDAMAAALLDLLGDPGSRAHYAAAAKAWVHTHASIDALAEAYVAFYRDAASGATGRPAPVDSAG